MSDKKDPGSHWKQTSVVIRSDIWLKAAEMGLDISDELNKRLAGLVGINYQQQQLPNRLSPDIAVCAADATGKGAGPRQKPPTLHPVINADDPAAASKVRKAKQQLPPEPVPEVAVPDALPLPEADISSIFPVPKVSQRGGAKSSESRKKGKDEVLKKFVTAKIIRVDADDAVISKDDMYQAFARWCRDHRITTIPERKAFATLIKNKFAIAEKNVGGTSCWVHVRFK